MTSTARNSAANAAKGSKESAAGDDPAHWPVVAARAADDKLGSSTLVIDVGDVLGITGYFVISSGASHRQVRAIADEVELQLKQAGGEAPLRVEGRGSFDWVLMDYGDFVVHVFHEEARTFYELERLWSDRPKIDWTPG